MKFQEFDMVRILKGHDGIKAGEIGTVIEVYCKPREAYEVEFADEMGRTTAQSVFLPTELEKIEWMNSD